MSLDFFSSAPMPSVIGATPAMSFAFPIMLESLLSYLAVLALTAFSIAPEKRLPMEALQKNKSHVPENKDASDTDDDDDNEDDDVPDEDDDVSGGEEGVDAADNDDDPEDAILPNGKGGSDDEDEDEDEDEDDSDDEDNEDDEEDEEEDEEDDEEDDDKDIPQPPAKKRK